MLKTYKTMLFVAERAFLYAQAKELSIIFYETLLKPDSIIYISRDISAALHELGDSGSELIAALAEISSSKPERVVVLPNACLGESYAKNGGSKAGSVTLFGYLKADIRSLLNDKAYTKNIAKIYYVTVKGKITSTDSMHELAPSRDEISQISTKITDSSVDDVFGQNGRTFCFGEFLSYGANDADNAVYLDRTGKFTIKLFRNGRTFAMKRKLVRLMELSGRLQKEHPGICDAFPMSLIYSENVPDDKYWIGYVMPFQADKSLENACANVNAYKSLVPDPDKLTVFSICIKLCECVRALHNSDILLSDIKPSNFFLTSDLSVYPIDTDGFSVEGGVSQPPLPKMCPGGRDHTREIGSWRQDMRTEAFALANLIFWLLTGVDSFQDGGMKFDIAGTGVYQEILMDEYAAERAAAAGEAFKPQKTVKPVEQAFYKTWFSYPNALRHIFVKIKEGAAQGPSPAEWIRIFRACEEIVKEGGCSAEIKPDAYPHVIAGGLFYSRPCYLEKILDNPENFNQAVVEVVDDKTRASSFYEKRVGSLEGELTLATRTIKDLQTNRKRSDGSPSQRWVFWAAFFAGLAFMMNFPSGSKVGNFVYKMPFVQQIENIAAGRDRFDGFVTILSEKPSKTVLRKYTGMVAGRKFNGFGTAELSNGDVYRGSFLNGNISGYGEYILTDGIKYEGYWINGLMYGYGAIYASDESVLSKGVFVDGIPPGGGAIFRALVIDAE
ncbi:MAG: hypothetical protein LBU32_28330 [Clostridiales bacterium]|nr:hypothetical protein [Clostridiales bacterium]